MNYLRICASLGLLVSYVAGQGCSTDDYQPVTSALNSFPPLWSPATILPNDTAARSRWDSISNNIPTNIPLKGTANGDYENDAQSYDSADPDCWWTVSQCISPNLPELPPDIADVPEPNTLGYSFDDGPSCSHDRLYGYLDNQHQKATMFFIGSNVISWPLQTQRAFSDGHEICLHTWSHSYMTALSSEVAFAELYYTMKAIKLVAGVTPTCWRPPYGDVDDRIRAIANQLGLRTVLWNYDSNDWTDNVDNVDQNYEKIIEDAEQGKFNKRGAILLMHELDNFTMSKAIEFYPRLKSVFKYIVPVGVSINESHPYVEGGTSLPSFQQYNNLSVTSAVIVSGSSIPTGITSTIATKTYHSTFSLSSRLPQTSEALSDPYSLTGGAARKFGIFQIELICLVVSMATCAILAI